MSKQKPRPEISQPTQDGTIKPVLYLITGASGVGKSWVCKQLKDHFNYLPFDGIRNKHHLNILRNPKMHSKPMLYDPTFKSSTFVRRYGSKGTNEFDIHFIVVAGDFITCKAQLINRGGKLTKTFYKRWKAMQARYRTYGEFIGSSSEVLKYLKEVSQQ